MSLSSPHKTITKRDPMPRSLAKLAADQLLAAHNESAMDMLDTLWANPEVHAEIVRRVMSKERENTKERHYELRKTDYVALMCTAPSDAPGMIEGVSAVSNVLCPADKLPEWLFTFLSYWVRDTLKRERPYPVPASDRFECQPAPRCGMGGLYFNAPTCEYFLEAYDCVVCNEMATQMFKDLNMDVGQEFAYEMSEHHEKTGMAMEAMDPLILWPKKTWKKVRDFLEQNHWELMGDEFVSDLDEQMANLNAAKWRLPAPVVTLFLDSGGWDWL